ncbi:calcium-binding protein [Shimia sagamensis]|uniref:Hemolysin-type calcium-binding repeat-containing protein n=1 Tax=Shimia sagamensis TaxID=1566352 RepID=A0ABY1NLJ9_9RHOB|nr:calcium-binding protein [Shimia sagamensis]SMP10814.1 Hemolysin-type calcium-binding repeat-containing protein [Shimia sagamensis]
MMFLGLLLAGLGIAAIADFGGSDDGDSDDGNGVNTNNDLNTNGGINDEITSRSITRDGEVGLMLEGSDNDNEIYATNGPDILSGEDGDDSLRGRDGQDYLLGGDGADSLYGQSSDDVLHGGAGDDELHGGSGNDTLFGAGGDDALYGGPGNDELVGTDIFNRDLEIADRYTPEDPSTPLAVVTPTQAEANLLDGGDGDDCLLVGEGDTATGGAGHDHFEVGYWVEDEDNVPVVTDFNEAEDVIEVHYLAGDPEPTITLETESDETMVYADGQLVLRVQGDSDTLTTDDVQLAEITVS